ncbi:MAG: AMP-binding protein [Actinobacteria bacterium]|nr:AMP-binding protein [Actinomycetota bacterium]
MTELGAAAPAPPVWTPDPALVAASNVGRFMAAYGLATHEELLARSVEEPEWFWDAVVSFLGLEWFTPYDKVLDVSEGIEWAKWFVGGRLNVAHNCVDRHAAARPDAVALIWEGEDGDARELSYAELRVLTDQIASLLASRGIAAGDAVGIFLPMVPETVAALMAVAKLGARFLPIFSGYAADAIAVRLDDGGAKALVTADGFLRRGQPVLMKEIADEAVAAVPSVDTVVVVSRLGRTDVPMTAGRDVLLDEFAGGEPVPSLPVDSEHVLFIAYTSGTTGRPKGAVHVHGGFLAKIAEEVAFQTDLRVSEEPGPSGPSERGRGDRLFWVTDMGWIMGPWEVFGTLASGGTLVLYEGAPDFPGPDRLWSLVERHAVTILGVSPTLVRALRRHGDEPVLAHDLSSLRILGSTGEPWNEDPWRWYFEVVGQGRCPVINISGGTEVGACFLSPHVTQPLSPCSLGGPSLGMAVDVFDDAGRPVRGEVGELVCTKPWPGMTRGVWGDPQRYIETYWSTFPGVWRHGDWASVSADGQWFLHGRSDDTLNVAGKRIGPAEIETVLVSHPAVVEAAVVGVPDEVKGEALWCYVVLGEGEEAGDGLRAELADLVAARMGKAFRPGAVRFTTGLPKTRSAKVVRRAIRAVAIGADPGDLSSLEDPAALDAIAGAG